MRRPAWSSFAIIIVYLLVLTSSNYAQERRGYYGIRNRACTSREFRCRNEECIDASKRCDGVPDCRDVSDEYGCPRCREDEFECASGTCVSKMARCDGHNDCDDRSDEYNCTVTTCSSDQFRCLDGICLSIDKRCNGVADCRNGEDEIQCGECHQSLFLTFHYLFFHVIVFQASLLYNGTPLSE